jgi:hypothetical protein
MAAAWFSATDNALGDMQLYKLGSDGSVTQWTANPGLMGSGLTPLDLTGFNNSVWFGGVTPANGFQLFKLGNNGSVTQWTSIGANLFPNDLTLFNNAVWFNGSDTTTNQQQLYKLGSDGSVTKWTANPGNGAGLNPQGDMTVFNDALWFGGVTASQGTQLYKLGFDGSVTDWTAINPGGGGLNPFAFSQFNGALWFGGFTASQGAQLFKLGADGSVTQWTAVPGGFNPQLVSMAANDPDSTPSSIFENAAWLQGTNPATGTELYKLGADGSLTFWKDINPGAPSSAPHDWAVLG